MVYAWDSSASINTVSIYETNSADFILSVNNAPGNGESINNVSLMPDGFAVDSEEEVSGWADNLIGNTLSWDVFLQNGFDWLAWLPFINLGISSDATQNFRFHATAAKVDQDVIYSWPITSTFHDSTSDVRNVLVTVLNDYTGPILEGWTINDGSFIKKGTNNLPAAINATDPETGVLQVFFNYVDCADKDNASAKTSLNLTKDMATYSSIADVSQYDDSTDVCFSFVAENNGGAFSNYSGIITIDGIAPVVTLVAPENNALMNSLSQFEFIADDNLAPTMECNLYSDGVVYTTVTANDNENTLVAVDNMPEGTHNWSVSCTDLAGWTGLSSETRTYILDRTPPTITLNNPQNGAIVKSGTMVDISVSDNMQLGHVSYSLGILSPISAGPSIRLNTSDFPDGPTVISVNATDAAGNNVVQDFVVIVDRKPPVVTLTEPDNGESLDYHIQFVFDANDDWDQVFNCTVYMDSQAVGFDTINTTDSTSGVLNMLVGLGEHQWYVACTDDAENTNTSEIWNFTALDLTGPDITVNSIAPVVRGNAAILNITLYDISGIDDESASANVTSPSGISSLVELSKNGGYYTGNYITTTSSDLGNYNISVYAEDMNGNSNTGAGIFEVTYGYVVTLNVAPNPAETNQQVALTGSVKKDDDSLVPDEFVTLVLPDTTLQTAIDPSTGGFTYVFSYGTAGQYNITASITAENGFVFGDSEMLTVNAPAPPPAPPGGGGGNGNPTFDCPVGKCYEDGSCVPCTEDKEVEIRAVSVPEQSEADDHSNSGVVEHSYCGDGTCDQNEHYNNCPQDCEEETVGVGRAAGFLNLKAFRSDLFWWVILILLSIMFVLTYMKKRGLPGFRKEDEFGIDNYLNRRNQQ